MGREPNQTFSVRVLCPGLVRPGHLFFVDAAFFPLSELTQSRSGVLLRGMKPLFIAIALLATFLAESPAQTIQQGQTGRYHLFIAPDGKYAFDTNTGALYILRSVKSEFSSEETLQWVQVSKSIQDSMAAPTQQGLSSEGGLSETRESQFRRAVAAGANPSRAWNEWRQQLVDLSPNPVTQAEIQAFNEEVARLNTAKPLP